MTITSTTHSGTDPSADHGGVTKRRSRRRAWTLVGIGAAIAIGGSAIAIDFALRDDDQIVKTFDGPVTSVSIDVSGGSVTIIGTDDSTANVTLDIQSGLRGPSHHETLENGRLVIASNCPLGLFTSTCATDYVVHVPDNVDVQLHGGGANVDISGVIGDVDVAIDGGNVDVIYNVAPTALKARANGGDIDIVIPDDGDTQYRVDASSSGGSTDVAVRSDPTSDRLIDVHTNGGSISVVYGDDT